MPVTNKKSTIYHHNLLKKRKGIVMSKKTLAVLGEKSFEDLKHLNQHGAEYWNARELQPMLGYSQWRRFEDAIKRAMISCEKSGNNPAYHFAGAGKVIA